MAATAVLFDLDGTLWDSHPWFARLIALEGHHDESRVLGRLRSLRPAAKLLKDAGIDERRFAGLCRGDSRPELYLDAREALGELIERRVPLGAVTNLPRWVTDPMLRCLNLADMLSAVVTYGDTRRRKPHPDPLLCAAELLDVAPGPTTWYVGDSSTDWQAATAAGMSFAWASWGYSAEPPDPSVRSLSGLAEVSSL